MSIRRQRAARAVASREGAAMLVVMLVLLMATATAIFSVHATSYELRAAGHTRRAMQTQYVGETGAVAAFSWVDRWGPGALLRAMGQHSARQRSAGKPVLAMPEHVPPLAEGKNGYRLYLQDLRTSEGLPVNRESLGGDRQPYDVRLTVDVYDSYTWTGTMAGERADGRARLKFMRATYTARGRTRLASPTTSSAADFHEGASNARGHGISGPFGN